MACERKRVDTVNSVTCHKLVTSWSQVGRGSLFSVATCSQWAAEELGGLLTNARLRRFARPRAPDRWRCAAPCRGWASHPRRERGRK
eukprot:360788-Pyramimonas_sp.AAC.1